MTTRRAGAPSDPVQGVEALAEAALRLLEAVPQRPERLRVTAGDLTVELDWRTPPARMVSAGETPTPSHGPQLETKTPDGQAAAVEPPGPVLHQVCAPTVGTFYHAPSPGEPPFVAEGDVIAAGQQIGIVEAMKLMVPVESDRAGRVACVHVADGKPVEYGEPLLSLDPVHPDPA